MRAMRLGKTGNQRPQIALGKPLRHAPFQYTLPAASHAGDHNHRARAALVRRTEKARERCTSGILGMAVQVQGPGNLDSSTPNTLFGATILRRRRRGFGKSWRWLRDAKHGRFRPAARHGRRLFIARRRPARLHARGDAPPKRSFIFG